MTEQEIIAMMVESFNNDNRQMSEQVGMAPEEINDSIERSTPSIQFMLTNILHKLKENNLIVVE